MNTLRPRSRRSASAWLRVAGREAPAPVVEEAANDAGDERAWLTEDEMKERQRDNLIAAAVAIAVGVAAGIDSRRSMAPPA